MVASGILRAQETRLERLALESGLEVSELRAVLRRLVDARCDELYREVLREVEESSLRRVESASTK